MEDKTRTVIASKTFVCMCQFLFTDNIIFLSIISYSH